MTFPLRHMYIIALLVLAGCATTRAPTRFYTLSAPSPDEAAQIRSGSPLFIQIMPVGVPERLARPQLVVRSAANAAQVRVLEQDRWSSPFDYELRDAFTSSISWRMHAIDISRGGRPANARSYRIAIELVQLDAVPDSHLQAAFSWSIKRSDDGLAALCRADIAQSVDGGIPGLVQGMQQAVARVSTDISMGITALETGQAPVCAATKG